MKRRMIAVLLSGILLCSAAGCGKEAVTDKSTAASSSQEVTETPAAEESPEASSSSADSTAESASASTSSESSGDEGKEADKKRIEITVPHKDGMEALYDTVDGLTVGTCGPALPVAHNLTVPADISSAAFWMVAAASRPGSRLTLRQVGLNKTRNAVISALQWMGARMDIVPTSPEDAGEPYGDITVYGSDSLHGTSLLPEEIPNLIDEIPILAVAGALGRGDFIVRNARELRVKETDRIATTAANLRLMGVDVEEFDDGMVVHGGTPLKGTELSSYGDHRIAMSFLVAGLSAQGETVVTDAECINTSYPGFERDLAQFL